MECVDCKILIASAMETDIHEGWYGLERQWTGHGKVVRGPAGTFVLYGVMNRNLFAKVLKQPQ